MKSKIVCLSFGLVLAPVLLTGCSNQLEVEKLKQRHETISGCVESGIETWISNFYSIGGNESVKPSRLKASKIGSEILELCESIYIKGENFGDNTLMRWIEEGKLKIRY